MKQLTNKGQVTPPGVEPALFDLHKYNKYLSEWTEFTKNKPTGKHKCYMSNGILSKLPTPSVYTKVRSTTHWMSVAKPADMRARIDAYFVEPVCLSDDSNIDLAFGAVDYEICEVLHRPVAPFSWHKTLKLIPQDTSPGFPLNRMGFTQKRQCNGLKQRFQVMKSQLRRKWKIPVMPCIAGVRNQLCEIGTNRPRLTWIYPMEMTMLEAMFALPLFEKLRHCSILAWDIDWHSGGLPRLMSKIPQKNATLGKDVSHFDADCLETRIRRAFGLLRKHLSLTQQWEKNAWKLVVDYFVNTWIVMYDDAYLTDHGVPSGSYFTQIIDSILNATATFDTVNHLSLARGFRKQPACQFSEIFRYWNFLGDDSLAELKFDLYTTDSSIMETLFLERHNFTLHPDKGFFHPVGIDAAEYDDFPEFLGYTLESSQDLTVSEERLRAQISIPEDADTCPEDLAIRLIGLGYSHGTSYRNHRLLQREYDRLSREYDLSILTWKKDGIRNILKYVLYMQELPTTFPRYKDIVSRFRGLPALSKCLSY